MRIVSRRGAVCDCDVPTKALSRRPRRSACSAPARRAAPTKSSRRSSNAPLGTSSSLISACRPSSSRSSTAGEPADAIILSFDIERLIKQGKVAANSRVVLGRTGVGVAIPQGVAEARRTAMSDALKRSLLGAKVHRDLGRRQQRTIRPYPARPARHRRRGEAEDQVRRLRPRQRSCLPPRRWSSR